MSVHTLVLALDLLGTFVFALSGALAGVKHRLDLFGVLVLSFAAATAGGITRDVIIGAQPPVAISDWRYIVASLLAGLLTFYQYPHINRFRSSVQVFDAGGLALFAVSGALKAINHDMTPVSAILLGALTGIGGGIARDLLVSEIPTVLRAELYAIAALAGATVVAAGEEIGLASSVSTIAGAALCFGLRLTAIRRGWQLPTSRHHHPPPTR